MAAPLVRTVVTQNTAGHMAGLPLNTAAASPLGVIVFTGGNQLRDPDGSISLYGGQLLSMLINNSSTAFRTVQLYLLANGSAANETTKIFEEQMAPKEIILWQPKRPLKYKDLATVRGWQDAGTDVFVRIDAVEFY